MRVFAMICTVAPMLFAQSQPDATAILRKVGDTYANAKQYRFAIKKTGEERGVMEIAVQKPGRFRFEADGRVIDGADAFSKVTMVSDGASAWNYSAEPGEYTQKMTTLPLLDTEPPDITPETFVLQADAIFLTHFSEFAKAADRARLAREDVLPTPNGNIDCYVFEFHAPLPGFRDDYTWWVDRQRYLVLREDTRPATPRRPPSSTIYTLASIDEPLPAELFRFTPPAGAKRVGRLEQ